MYFLTLEVFNGQDKDCGTILKSTDPWRWRENEKYFSPCKIGWNNLQTHDLNGGGDEDIILVNIFTYHTATHGFEHMKNLVNEDSNKT